ARRCLRRRRPRLGVLARRRLPDGGDVHPRDDDRGLGRSRSRGRRRGRRSARKAVPAARGAGGGARGGLAGSVVTMGRCDCSFSAPAHRSWGCWPRLDAAASPSSSPTATRPRRASATPTAAPSSRSRTSRRSTGSHAPRRWTASLPPAPITRWRSLRASPGGSGCRTRSSPRRRHSQSRSCASASGSRRPASRSRARSHAAAEAAAAAAELGFPLVVEAPNPLGERAVRLARTADELAAATAGAIAESRGDYVLVEELPGLRTVTVHAFVLGGRFVPLMLTDPDPAPAPAFGVALAHLYPAELDDDDAHDVRDTAAAAAAALGIANGPVTSQLLLGPSKPLVAKVSARLGGAHEAELCRIALGIDESALAVAAALGEPLRDGDLAPALAARGACVRFLVAPPGVLTAVEGGESASAVDGVRSIRIYRNPGHVFGE